MTANIQEARYIVGIDLGTTNSALSYVDLLSPGKNNRGIRLFPIPQLTAAGEVTRLPVLPSFCYLPGRYDIDEDAVRLPWQAGKSVSRFVGAFARDHGAKVPARLISSAKSWLCHAQADRRAKILPWGSAGDIPKMSPVEATAAYLQHLRDAWNHVHGEEEAHLENQFLVITVPASFDEVARDLTLEAAKMAGLGEVLLLEEPLAAFYSWLIRHENDWRDHIAPGELVLVCDVGGGTTDLTLITLRETEGTPRFERIAVGDHLILGGDNIDLALARYAEQQFGAGANLAGDRWKTLCHLCRQAKENILNQGSERQTVTMMGEGGRLIGGTLTAVIDRQSLEEIVLEGFFPLVEKSEPGAGAMRKGISEFGLPYEPDPAITRHIGHFLERHRADVENFLGSRPPFPDRILFNGGSLKARPVRERIRQAVARWFQAADTERPRELENRDLDVAVALGASYYGLVKAGKGVRVGSGSPRSYYLGIGEAGKRDEGVRRAVCVVERGLDEGSRVTLAGRRFEVLANRPVTFDLFSSSYRSGDRAGDVIPVDETMIRMPPIQTVIQFGQKGVQAAIPVRIEAEYTETGVLELWCRSLSTNHRWQLRFQLRRTPEPAAVSESEVFDSELVDRVIEAIDAAFSGDAPGDRLSGLVKTVSGIIRRSRDDWPLSLIRKMADALLERIEDRKRSPEHEVRWLNLVGFCLRPGFGDGLDEQRVSRLWKIYKPGVIFKKNQQAAAEWWILWRRVAGGLNDGRQRQFVQDLGPMLLPRKGPGSRVQPQQRLEMWMALASMERLAAGEKKKWGDALLAEITPKKERPQQFWALARIGARQLLYGPVDRVVDPGKAGHWVAFLLETDWKHTRAAGNALVQMSRKTGDRARDLEEPLRQRVIGWLEEHGMEDEAQALRSVTPLEPADESAIFGESLPAGLILHA